MALQLIRALALTSVLCANFTLPVSAQTAPQPPAMTPPAVESFYRLPQFGAAALNPSSTHLAFLREIKGRLNLVVMDLATREFKNVAGYDNADVIDLQWLSDQRLLYRVSDIRVGIGDSDKYGVFASDRDGSQSYTLSEGFVTYGGAGGAARGLPARAAFYKRARSGNRDEFIAIEYSNAPLRSSLMRVNSRNGTRSAIDTGSLANAIEWALDANDVPRAALTLNGELQALHVRDATGAPWRKVAEFNQFDGTAVAPLAFDKAGNLYVSGRLAGRDMSAIYRFDWAKGAPESEPLVSVKGFDIESGLLFDADGEHLIGVRYEAETEATHWLDPKWADRQAAVDRALRGKANLLSGKSDGPIVVRSYSDTSPARYYLMDPLLGKMSLLGASRPWVEEKLQSPGDFIRYDARDGLNIPALLTLPKGKEAKALPLVVLVHGGPFLRGVPWGWYQDRQFLASRGYAVLEPEFRGSRGYGWKHFKAGWKQLGLAMQDDLADGVEALVKRGIVDRNRVCIAGASYGGYATVFGLIKHPEIYKCGVSWVGVTDIELLYTVGWSDTGNNAESLLGLTRLFGDRQKDKEQLRATSAVTQASRLKAPLILAYGREDVRVPYDHGEQLRDALKGKNDQVDFVVYAGEGHGWRLLNTNMEFWNRVEKFLNQHIGR